MEENKKNKIKSLLKELLVYGFIFMVIVVIVPKYVFSKTIVDGDSMETSLHNEDYLIQDKISYQFHQPKRFDVVVFYSPIIEKEHWVKRVIGLPGETVQIIDGRVYINGKILEEDIYGKELIIDPGIAKVPIVVPEGEYFVMGDNRNESWDSRSEVVKTIKEKDIEGRIVCRIYPFQSIGKIK